jgi:hypothetical protein
VGKYAISLFTALLVGCGWTSFGATNVAQVRMFCQSVRFAEGVASVAGLNYTLNLYSGSDPSQPNGELWSLLSEEPPTHKSQMVMDGPDFIEPMEGWIALTVPETLDDNANGLPDFYEVDQAVPATTTPGVFEVAVDQGDVTAVWQRAAGSRQGTCRVQFTGATFGALPPFEHLIEVIEYRGTLSYLPSTNVILGTVNLAQVGQAAAKLSGPVQMNRYAAAEPNRLIQTNVVWMDGSGLEVPLYEFDIEPEPGIAMDYFGPLVFENGDPTTPEVDFELYFLGIDDPNDADADGIPDLSDLDMPSTPTPPTLGIGPSGAQLTLTLAGEAGGTYEVQSTPSLGPANWTAVTTVVLSNQTQAIDLARPPGATTFWRALQK